MITRKRVAQLAAAVAGAAVFLPWEASSGPEAPTVQGLDTDEGRITLIVALITISLVQIGWRPAWIGAGFVLAIAGRRLMAALGDDPGGPGLGLWIAAAAALAAAALLVVDLFTAIDRGPPESDG